MTDGDRMFRAGGKKGECGRDDIALPLENLRGALWKEPSSSLSGGTERMLWKLRGDLGYFGDCGARRPPSDRKDRCDRVEPLVSVRGCVDCTESTLFVRLGGIGKGASTFSFGSTGSGDDARGMPKKPCAGDGGSCPRLGLFACPNMG